MNDRWLTPSWVTCARSCACARCARSPTAGCERLVRERRGRPHAAAPAALRRAHARVRGASPTTRREKWECVRGIDKSFGYNRASRAEDFLSQRRADPLLRRHRDARTGTCCSTSGLAARTRRSRSRSSTGCAGSARGSARTARRSSARARGSAPKARRRRHAGALHPAGPHALRDPARDTAGPRDPPARTRRRGYARAAPWTRTGGGKARGRRSVRRPRRGAFRSACPRAGDRGRELNGLRGRRAGPPARAVRRAPPAAALPCASSRPGSSRAARRDRRGASAAAPVGAPPRNIAAHSWKPIRSGEKVRMFLVSP